MEAQSHPKMREKVEEKQQQQTTTVSPPSASSSPSHEFSFTISLHPEATKTTDKKSKCKTPPSFAIDLSPADDIFFHGHLLPLHLLSHRSVSPRSSTNDSLDSFTLPIRELIDDQNPEKSSNINRDIGSKSLNQTKDVEREQRRTKSKSFSLFQKWKRRCEVREKEDKESSRKKKKLKFDVSHVIKRYVRLVRPLLFFRRRRGLYRQPHSFSGNLGLRRKPEVRGKRGEFSAPASLWTSPTNSGPLLPTGALATSTSDSTMEELQAAIQAAIAHCKNSIAMEENIKCL